MRCATHGRITDVPTVSLDIDRCWITLADDLDGDAIVCGSTQTTPGDSQLDGDLRHYAGNRVRAVIRDQDDRTLTYTLRHLSPTEFEKLKSWRGRVVLLRTMDGQRIFCVYSNPQDHRVIGTTPDDDPDGIATFDVDVIFFRVTFDEAV
jgi:hypothetical protein